MDKNMKVKFEKDYTLKIYLQKRRKPIILTGLTKNDIDDFTIDITTKEFIKFKPIIIRTQSIDYVVIKK